MIVYVMPTSHFCWVLFKETLSKSPICSVFTKNPDTPYGSRWKDKQLGRSGIRTTDYFIRQVSNSLRRSQRVLLCLVDLRVLRGPRRTFCFSRNWCQLVYFEVSYRLFDIVGVYRKSFPRRERESQTDRDRETKNKAFRFAQETLRHTQRTNIKTNGGTSEE